MLLRHLAEMHSQPRHEPIQDQFREGDDQDEFDRVLKQKGLIADLPCNSIDGGIYGNHSVYPRGNCELYRSRKDRVNVVRDRFITTPRAAARALPGPWPVRYTAIH